MAQRTAARIGLFLGDAMLGLAIFLMMSAVFSHDGRAQSQTRWEIGTANYVSQGAVGLAQGLRAEPLSIGLIGPSAIDYPARSTPLFRYTNHRSAEILLAVVFSLLVAINLGFFRHLRRAYGRPN